MAIPGRDERGPCYALCGCCTFFGCLLTVILVPLTYSKLEYFQHGIVQQKSTSKVDRTAVYGSGSHPIGPDYQFKIFETNALNFDDSVAVWTKATGDNAGATLTMDVSFQYRIDEKRIGALYDQIGTDYEPMIRSYAIDAIRNTAPLFGADEFLLKVARARARARPPPGASRVHRRARAGALCLSTPAPQRAEVEQVLARNVSAAINKVHCRVVSLQLRRVNFEDDYKSIKLTTAIQDELNEAEVYVQEAQLIRLETDVEASVTEYEADRVRTKAKSQADLIVSRANIAAAATIEAARSAALSGIYDTLGVDNEAQRLALSHPPRHDQDGATSSSTSTAARVASRGVVGGDHHCRRHRVPKHDHRFCHCWRRSVGTQRS